MNPFRSGKIPRPSHLLTSIAFLKRFATVTMKKFETETQFKKSSNGPWEYCCKDLRRVLARQRLYVKGLLALRNVMKIYEYFCPLTDNTWDRCLEDFPLGLDRINLVRFKRKDLRKRILAKAAIKRQWEQRVGMNLHTSDIALLEPFDENT